MLTLGPLQTNCYILYQQGKALIVDPANDGEHIIKELDALKLEPVAVLLTHAHFDHIGALESVRENYQIPVYIHETESEWLTNPSLNGSQLFGAGDVICQEAENDLKEGNLRIDDFQLEVRHIPGHSPGGVSFIFHQHHIIIGGDSLFRQAIGRTDLPGGSMEALLENIEEKLFTLPGTYTVYPGHGPSTTIEEEKQENPFFN